MSILFYRRPDYLAKPDGPLNKTDCEKYMERAKTLEGLIPHGLSFEDIIGHKSLPVRLPVAGPMHPARADILSHAHLPTIWTTCNISSTA